MFEIVSAHSGVTCPMLRVPGLTLACLFATAAVATAADPTPDFNRDVRPLLSQKCFKCHGPDDSRRESGVRLDGRDTAIGTGDSGLKIIVPGRPDDSELVRRIEAADPDMVMPPPSSNLELSAAEKQTLRRWIAAGAEYQPHWAFVPPRQGPLPKVKQTDWPRNAIDHFVLSAMETENMSPSQDADRATLIRRVTLDLIGLPPSLAEVEAFLADDRPDAYDRLVDRLLASPRYGERWARKWLDLARYADTNGYEKDRPRSIWPYRDWVIRSLNADQPFDQFTIEQLAGDLLPNATFEQRIATGFHRNTMLNEEGGIDPLEFRFHAMTDRLATTGAVWLGLTVGCAQCHTHKYDPLTHQDYYRLMAFLNNADEPEIDVPAPDVMAKRAALEEDIAARVAELPSRFPPLDPWTWEAAHVVEATSSAGATLTILPDESLLVSGHSPDTDTYTLVIETGAAEVSGLKLEALTDESLGNQGPGRTPHGNFVLTEVQADLHTAATGTLPIRFQTATADFAQDGFGAARAIDSNPGTGWAISGQGNWNVPRTLTAKFQRTLRTQGVTRWTIQLEQSHGQQHTLGRFRIQLGRITDSRPVTVRRQAHLDQKFTEWLSARSAEAVDWTVIRPERWTTTLPRLELLDDGSLLASGDQTKRDVYELAFGPEVSGATAIRLEAIPDERLPKHGPGHVYYEGPIGDFFLSEVQWEADRQPRSFVSAHQTFASGPHFAANSIDGNPLTGWMINGAQGQLHVAVFRFAEPLPVAAAHTLRMIFEKHYAAGLGRFRISYSTDPRALNSPAMRTDIEALLTIPETERTPAQRNELLRAFCAAAPELASERGAIDQLRRQLPEAPTTLVMRERPADNPRPTQIHKRGEFLQPTDDVSAGVPGFLHSLPEEATPDRLTFARWLVDERNPLVGRVTVNRHWGAFFGRGLVRTTEDFGYQGELPTHPELLDWLAVELVRRGWSIKELHRQIVTSATYRQASRVTPELAERDPLNRKLARGPRVRLDAELVRDVLLQTAGLLSDKQLGPSVFPPQPANVTTEGAYGRLAWNVSPGEDRYRRGLYTFAKRTAPYAMFLTFDGPSGEACVPRREISNTPLQALTLLNDAVFVETAQALGREFANRSGNDEERLTLLFRRCLARFPDSDELALLARFHASQRERLSRGELKAAEIAGGDGPQAVEQAAWMLTARAVLNLDETITRD
jgi:hypothetical protein